jgi:ABC-2 type transport system permease protein
VLLADRSLWLVTAILASLIVYALYNGFNATTTRERTIANLLELQQEKQRNNIAQLARIMERKEVPDPFANPADPASIGSDMGGRFAVMPILPLAPLAFGQSDIQPDYYQITYRSKANFMYDTEIENPWNLLTGHFDLSFVIIYVLPLLIFSLSYNLLSAEREHGTLKMLLSQPVNLSIIVVGKLAVRALPVLACATLLPAMMLLALRPGLFDSKNISLLLLLIAVTIAYGLFWFVLVLLVNAWGRSSEANALVLISSWVFLVLILPIILNLVVSTLEPAPSRTELATRTRLIAIHTLNHYNELLSADYRYTTQPETLLPKDGKIDVPIRRKGLFLLQRDQDQELQEMLNRFETQLAAQQALVDRFSFLSPAIVVSECLTALAGSGTRRHLHFRKLVDRFHSDWKAYFEPRILRGVAINEADFQTMPTFSWQEQSFSALVIYALFRLLQILIPTLVMVWLTRRLLLSYRVI